MLRWFTPIQLRYFEHEQPDPHHYNHAMLLEVRRALDPDVLARALLALEQHHDALRLRFRRADQGDALGELLCEMVGKPAP